MAKKTTAKSAKKTTKKVVKKVSGKAVKKASPKAKKTVKKVVKKAAVKASTKKAVKKSVKKTVSVKAPAKKAVVKKAAVTTRVKKTLKSKMPKNIKTQLTKEQLKAFKAMLMEKRRSIIGDMNGIEAEAYGGSGDLSTVPTHPADMGTDSYEQEFSLGLLQSEHEMLAEIDEALQRIDNKTYGICVGTGKPINPARLRARPWAKYSIEYARMKEKGLLPRIVDEDDGRDDDRGDDRDDDRDDE